MNIIEPRATKSDNLAEAKRWLEKAIQFEDEGKSKTLVERCLDKACAYELAAFAN